MPEKIVVSVRELIKWFKISGTLGWAVTENFSPDGKISWYSIRTYDPNRGLGTSCFDYFEMNALWKITSAPGWSSVNRRYRWIFVTGLPEAAKASRETNDILRRILELEKEIIPGGWFRWRFEPTENDKYYSDPLTVPKELVDRKNDLERKAKILSGK